MKVVILAGGYGTRLSEETEMRPKPMVEIGSKPILWHIMKIYSSYGFNDFIILAGYKSYYIKEYFANYFLHQSDVTFDMVSGSMEVHNNSSEPWKVTVLDTGLETMTGGRILQAQKFIGNEPFFLTYGDGVANINIKELLAHHKKSKKAVTVTAIQPEAKFGALDIDETGNVVDFIEKPKGEAGWINAGFFVCEAKVFDYIQNDETTFEQTPMLNLAKDNNLNAYKHFDFWKCMDTLRDKYNLNTMCNNNEAPWKTW